MNEIDWIDLPDDNYLAILGCETKNTMGLDEFIRKYNQIPKDQTATLSCRIRKLDEISHFIKEWIDHRLEAIDKKKHLIWISEIATKKKNYLVELLRIYQNKLHENEAQNAYHAGISFSQDTSKTPIVLNNHRFFSLKMREYWGDFWFETLDPCHRRLTPFLDQWRALKKTNDEIPHFFLWLETQNIPKYVPKVTYFRGESLERRRIMIKGGFFWEKNNEDWILANFNLSSKRYLFSIDLAEEIYVAEEETGISHSSFTCGKPVMGAGLLKIDQGCLVSLALESGHYTPSVEIGYQILKIFEEKGAQFPCDLEVVFFYDRNKYATTFSANPLPSLDQFKEILESAYASKSRSCYESSPV